MGRRRSERTKNDIDYSKLAPGFSCDDDDDFVDSTPRPQKKIKVSEFHAKPKIVDKPRPIVCEKYVYNKEIKDVSVSRFTAKENDKQVEQASIATHSDGSPARNNIRKDLQLCVSLTDVLAPLVVAENNSRDGKSELCFGLSEDAGKISSELVTMKSHLAMTKPTKWTPSNLEKFTEQIKPNLTESSEPITDKPIDDQASRTPLFSIRTSKPVVATFSMDAAESSAECTENPSVDQTVARRKPVSASKLVAPTQIDQPIDQPVGTRSRKNLDQSEISSKNKNIANADFTKGEAAATNVKNSAVSTDSPMPDRDQPVHVQTKVAARKWHAPGPANSCRGKVEPVARSSVSPGSGMRLGLSRNVKLKPLHSKVKAVT